MLGYVDVGDKLVHGICAQSKHGNRFACFYMFSSCPSNICLPCRSQRTRAPTKPPTPKPACSVDRDFNLCLAVDMSGSVCSDDKGSECINCQAGYFSSFFSSQCRDSSVSKDTCCDNFANVKEFAALAVDLLDDFPAEKSFSVVPFATDARAASGLSSAAHTQGVLARLEYTGGRTNHAAALRACQRGLSGGGARKNFILLVTDGVSSEPSFDPAGAAEAAAKAAKVDGTFIVPVFISSTNDWRARGFMRSLSSDGKVFDVTSFAGLNSLLDRLVDQVSCA